ncbi:MULTISPECIES: TetR/AcrR family transcriptional regulator [unclassified Nocardioides]|uniref:TetR/AcrR family transcriptional regulator n=1 Tax=unclassified Nocardioides TaxID=2615069 RepID=UPI0000570C32|nr:MULTISPECIES: TetR/AcrR family transcriptional regulator [unclassified Nocardioides]ABL83797.1 transcriptional regulator [Nocardioides sp. JS614]
MSVSASDEVTLATRSVRAERRRRQLLGAAARLMDRSGSESVSMQALADEAGVSVGLIYRYFGGKDDLLLAVIVEVLDTFAERVPAAIEESGDDPARRLAAAFRTYCEVIDEQRHAAVLTYRESRSLTDAGRERIKELEVSTSEPLREILQAGIERGTFIAEVDADLVAYNLLLEAHAWALKHWYFERTLTLDDYVRRQVSLVLRSLLETRHRRRYSDLLSIASVD